MGALGDTEEEIVMAENLYNQAHKINSDKYRDNWGPTFRKEGDMEDVILCHKCDVPLGKESESGHRQCPKCNTFWFVHPKGTKEEFEEARASYKEDLEKHGNQYGKQVVAVLDSLFGGRDWALEWLVEGLERHPDHLMYLFREDLLSQPNIQAAQDYIKAKEGV